jgi:hypothetical protein
MAGLEELAKLAESEELNRGGKKPPQGKNEASALRIRNYSSAIYRVARRVRVPKRVTTPRPLKRSEPAPVLRSNPSPKTFVPGGRYTEVGVGVEARFVTAMSSTAR